MNLSAAQIMPLMGVMDLFFGVLILFKPIRAVLLWMAVWGLAPLWPGPSPENLSGNLSKGPQIGRPRWHYCFTTVGLKRLRIGFSISNLRSFSFSFVVNYKFGDLYHIPNYLAYFGAYSPPASAQTSMSLIMNKDW